MSLMRRPPRVSEYHVRITRRSAPGTAGLAAHADAPIGARGHAWTCVVWQALADRGARSERIAYLSGSADRQICSATSVWSRSAFGLDGPISGRAAQWSRSTVTDSCETAHQLSRLRSK
jgi:hypothetical protein